jgi:hypothetical protein
VNQPLRRQIADAFRQEESMRAVPAGLRDEVVGAVMERSARTPGTPRLLVLAAVLLAAAVVATLVGLRRLPGQATPAATPTTHTIVSPTFAPSAAPTSPPVQFTTAQLASAVPGQLRGQVVVVLTETGLMPGQSVSYHVTGQVDLVYDCGSGGPGGPSYPIRGPVDFTATRTADSQGVVSANIAVPPPAGVPACTPPGHPAVVTGDWLDFVVEDTTSGVRKSAGGLDVAT